MYKHLFFFFFTILSSITNFGQPSKTFNKANLTVNNPLDFINDTFDLINNSNICNSQISNGFNYKPIEIITPLGNKIELQYDRDGKLLTQINYSWINNNWKVIDKDCYIYGSSGLLDTIFKLKLYGTVWIRQITSIYYYDSLGRLTKNLAELLFHNIEIYKTYNCFNKIATEVMKIFNKNNTLTFEYTNSYEYNTDGQILSHLVRKYDEQDGESSWKYTYSYDTSTRLSISFIDWLSDSIWVRCEKTEYYYNNDSLLSSTQTFNYLDTAWAISERVNYFYAFANFISKKTTTRYNNSLDLDTTCVLEKYDYDNNNNCVIAEGFIQQNNTWTTYPTNLRCTYNNNLDILETVAHKIEISYSTFTSVKEKTDFSMGFNLDQNYPNPFNPTTTISYNLPNSGITSLKIFDVLGKEVATLINEYQNQGNHSVNFDGSQLASGTYFYQLIFGNNIQTKKLLLLK